MQSVLNNTAVVTSFRHPEALRVYSTGYNVATCYHASQFTTLSRCSSAVGLVNRGITTPRSSLKIKIKPDCAPGMNTGLHGGPSVLWRRLQLCGACTPELGACRCPWGSFTARLTSWRVPARGHPARATAVSVIYHLSFFYLKKLNVFLANMANPPDTPVDPHSLYVTHPVLRSNYPKRNIKSRQQLPTQGARTTEENT